MKKDSLLGNEAQLVFALVVLGWIELQPKERLAVEQGTACEMVGEYPTTLKIATSGIVTPTTIDCQGNCNSQNSCFSGGYLWDNWTKTGWGDCTISPVITLNGCT